MNNKNFKIGDKVYYVFTRHNIDDIKLPREKIYEYEVTRVYEYDGYNSYTITNNRHSAKYSRNMTCRDFDSSYETWDGVIFKNREDALSYYNGLLKIAKEYYEANISSLERYRKKRCIIKTKKV